MSLEEYLPKDILYNILYRYLPFDEVIYICESFPGPNILDRFQVFIEIIRSPQFLASDDIITHYIYFDNECVRRLNDTWIKGKICYLFYQPYPGREYEIKIEAGLSDLNVCSITAELNFLTRLTTEGPEEGSTIGEKVIKSSRTYQVKDHLEIFEDRKSLRTENLENRKLIK